MKVGIGVITMGVREIPALFEKFCTIGDFYVYTDTERKGPGHARNQVLKHFEDYDYIFLFDDDCYPTMHGWEEYFINFAKQYGVDYMCLPEGFKTHIVRTNGEYTVWDGGLGAFTFLSKHGLKTIGYYNKDFGRYGLEDVAYRFRAKRAGLTGTHDGFAFPLRGLMYIHSMDVFGENPTPNLSHTDKMILVALNQRVYNQEMNSEQIYYPYA